MLAVTKRPDGAVFTTQAGTLRLQVCSERVVHVTFSPAAQPVEAKSLAVIGSLAQAAWQWQEEPERFVIQTGKVTVMVDRRTGAVDFQDAAQSPVLRETASGGRAFPPREGPGAVGTGVRQSFLLAPGEEIYGLGQHQDGVWNYRGHAVHLQQRNTEVAVPVLISSQGYGLLWDNPAVTDVAVGVDDAKDELSWNSEAGDAVDYYFLYGPSTDEIIHGYRQLTGTAPMFGRWAWGYWQSRERYTSQQELLGVAREYRRRQFPIDALVQDWQYWSPSPWGSHAFGPNFPDPKGMMDELHAADLHAIISVWPKFEQGSRNYDELEKAGFLYPPIYPNVYPAGKAKWYDAFNPGARQMDWRQMSDEIFSRGFDGWWLDATEPELSGKWGEFRDIQTFDGPGYKVFNAFPLMATTAVYEGQRAQTDDKRVFILTRSAFAGQQRNAAVVWSGDITGDWGTFKRQIPAGLNFVASGLPYWNTDIGGFFSPSNADDTYRELFVRWYQFGAFCPIFRAHGTGTQKEMWSFGPEVESILLNYDRLRYRLLPYIYSTAWQVTSADATMMRPLLMDFAADPAARAVSDQFLFGPALMACPVTEASGGTFNVVPSTRLATPAGQPGGLLATYYQGNNFEQKKLARRDAEIAFDWDKVKREGVGENIHRDPVPGLEMDHFSVRWEGFLLTTVAGDYRLQMSADDGMRLWVDGNLVIEDWASRAVATHTVTIRLPANARVPIKAEYYQDANAATVDLRWQPPGDHAVQKRDVYLPPGTWHDFWSGETLAGARTIQAEAPLGVMPLFVKAGSIIPMGPDVQNARQNADPIELRIYRGADGTFTLYEDEGDTYHYEKKVYATIPLHWDNHAGTLTIGQRQGSFPGMMAERTFQVVLVGINHGTGAAVTAKPDQLVHYTGEPVVLALGH